MVELNECYTCSNNVPYIANDDTYDSTSEVNNNISIHDQKNSYSDNSPDLNNKNFVPPDLDNPPATIPLKPLYNRYCLIKQLGCGSFGTVTLAKALYDCGSNTDKRQFKNSLLYRDPSIIGNNITKTQNIVAIKTMMSRLPTLHDYKKIREIKFILRVPANKHLVQIYEIFIDDLYYQLHIVMEYMDQNLYQMMKRRRNRIFSYPSLKSILAQIVSGLRHIHQYNFFHRDIKPENILISPSSTYFDKQWLREGNYQDNYVVKLADFGLARDIFNKHHFTSYVSTRWYRSPEILLRNGFYSKPLDIWAFGCVAIEVTTFEPLFPGSDEIDQIWKILKMLGSPNRIFVDKKNDIPSGGYWNDCLKLTNRLKLQFPDIDGISIDTLLPNPQLRDLIDVVKKCLLWDPLKRSTVEELINMNFFKDTIAQEELFQRQRECKTNTEQAMLFAGINSNSINNYAQQELLFNKNKEEISLDDLDNDENGKLTVIDAPTILMDFDNKEPKDEKMPYGTFFTDDNWDPSCPLEADKHVSHHDMLNNFHNELEQFCEETEEFLANAVDSDSGSNYITDDELSKEIEKSLNYYPMPREQPNSSSSYSLKQQTNINCDSTNNQNLNVSINNNENDQLYSNFVNNSIAADINIEPLIIDSNNVDCDEFELITEELPPDLCNEEEDDKVFKMNNYNYQQTFGNFNETNGHSTTTDSKNNFTPRIFLPNNSTVDNGNYNSSNFNGFTKGNYMNETYYSNNAVNTNPIDIPNYSNNNPNFFKFTSDIHNNADDNKDINNNRNILNNRRANDHGTNHTNSNLQYTNQTNDINDRSRKNYDKSSTNFFSNMTF